MILCTRSIVKCVERFLIVAVAVAATYNLLRERADIEEAGTNMGMMIPSPQQHHRFASMVATAVVLVLVLFVSSMTHLLDVVDGFHYPSHSRHRHHQANLLPFISSSSSSSSSLLLHLYPGRGRRGARDGNDEEEDEDVRTDVRNLLTQRSIQSFMLLCETCRDPHSIKWLEEEFLETQNSLEYHGTRAGYIQNKFNNLWYKPFTDMLLEEKFRYIIQAKRRGRGHGGWSKDNPYLEERFVEFPIDIDPINLCSRILSVREQIATEWINDLNILQMANDHILDSYFQQLKVTRDTEQRNNDGIGSGDGDGSSSSVGSSSQPQSSSFERIANTIFNNQQGFASSISSNPIRKGSFDLLYNLCTQRSIHRVLKSYQKEHTKNSDMLFHWFLEYYTMRVGNYFDGDVTYGRADDFIDELLHCSPTLVRGNSLNIIDPFKIAEDIITTRNVVIQEWKTIMENVPNDHTIYIRPILLEKQMSIWGSGSGSGSAETGTSGGTIEESTDTTTSSAGSGSDSEASTGGNIYDGTSPSFDGFQ